MLKFFMRKYTFKLFFLLVFFTEISHANFIDTKWKVSNVVGETWFSKSENIIGKYQEFYKGFSEGVFYSCDYAGQSATYNAYNLNVKESITIGDNLRDLIPGDKLGFRDNYLLSEKKVNHDSNLNIKIISNLSEIK